MGADKTSQFSVAKIRHKKYVVVTSISWLQDEEYDAVEVGHSGHFLKNMCKRYLFLELTST